MSDSSVVLCEFLVKEQTYDALHSCITQFAKELGWTDAECKENADFLIECCSDFMFFEKDDGKVVGFKPGVKEKIDSTIGRDPLIDLIIAGVCEEGCYKEIVAAYGDEWCLEVNKDSNHGKGGETTG